MWGVWRTRWHQAPASPGNISSSTLTPCCDAEPIINEGRERESNRETQREDWRGNREGWWLVWSLYMMIILRLSGTNVMPSVIWLGALYINWSVTSKASDRSGDQNAKGHTVFVLRPFEKHLLWCSGLFFYVTAKFARINDSVSFCKPQICCNLTNLYVAALCFSFSFCFHNDGLKLWSGLRLGLGLGVRVNPLPRVHFNMFHPPQRHPRGHFLWPNCRGVSHSTGTRWPFSAWWCLSFWLSRNN